MKVKLSVFLIVILIFSMGCDKKTTGEDAQWQRITDSVKGTTVNFYIWSDDEQAYAWFNTDIKSKLKSKYNIHLNITELEEEDVLARLTKELSEEQYVGDIDLLWLDASSFEMFQSKKVLYGPFATKIDNYDQYLSPKSLDNAYIESVPIDGFLVPFNQNQLTFYYDRDAIYDPPESLDMLKQLVDEKPGMFTYPHPSDPVGGAFVRSVILNFVDAKEFVEKPLSDQELKTLVKPAMDYLKALSPKLYNQGTDYPMNANELHELFGNGKVLVAMSFDYRHGNEKSGDALYPSGTRPFLFSDVGIGDKQYLGIPFNAKNKSGAMVVINEMISFEMQLNKLRNKTYHGLPVYDFKLLDDKSKSAIKNAIRKKTVIDIASLLEQRTHDIPNIYHQKIIDIWEAYMMSESVQ